MDKGQINRGSKLGDLIYSICRQEDVNTIVDIGTWNGMGTTKCIYDAIIENKKENYKVISIESNEDMYKKAIENLPKIENFELLLGRIVELDDLFNENSFGDEYFKKVPKHDLQKWLNEDIENYKKTKNVFELIPNNIDLLILDGGEFSSYAEFKMLESRSKYFILDDINAMKNLQAANEIRNNLNYIIIDDNPNERNGYLIAKKTTE